MTKRTTNEVTQLTNKIKAQFDVDYIGGVGFCGPRWREAQAAWDAAKDAAIDLDIKRAFAGVRLMVVK